MYINNPFILFIFGISIGSFLNVVIFRLPKNMSLFFPGSHCFACKTPVRFRDNIPVLGYFILKGKCRSCESTFSSRYALVELFSGIITCVLFSLYGFSQYFFIYYISVSKSSTIGSSGYAPCRSSLE